MSTKRDEILNTACELFEAQGYHATGLNQIIAESGAPKGSLYYYFPDGKEGLTEEAIERTSRSVEARIRQSMAETDDTVEAVVTFLRTLAHYVEASSYRAGGPITTVALEAANSSERLNEACRQAYGCWQTAFEEKLLAGGYSTERAERLASLLISLIEGAIVLCRTYRSPQPLLHAAEEIYLLMQVTA